MSEKNSNPYDLKTKKDEGYLYEEKPSGYLDANELINFLNRRKILIDRADNLPRFANNNNIIMAKVKRVTKFGSTPHVYKIPTESKIQEALKVLTKDKTTIVIAHRLSTILNSSNIYVIDSGKVVGSGKHEDLLRKSELYKHFYEQQIQK